MSALFGRVQFDNQDWYCSFQDDAAVLLKGDWLEGEQQVLRQVPLAEVAWLPPVVPRTILCVGRNYQAHAAELAHDVPAEPLFFLKQAGALTAHEALVEHPGWVGRVDYEGELVLVMGKRVRHVRTPEEARAAIWGVTIGNDITARELQGKDGQWTRAKGFDGFAPLGPWVRRGNGVEGLRVTTRVNGEIRQDATTDEMIFDCSRLVMDASRFMTLYPGDVIFTGTPAGVGPLQVGDIIEVNVSGIGTLRNSIKNGD